MDTISLPGMHAKCDEEELDMLTFEGMDEAIIGMATQGVFEVTVYDYDKLIALLMHTHEWSHEDALEWYLFNMTGYTNGCPVVMHTQVIPSNGEGVNAHGTG